MRALPYPDFARSPVVRKYFEDARILERLYGRYDGSINIGGPLNNAVSVLGESILAACADEVELATHVLSQMARACLQVDDDLVHHGAANAPASLRPACAIGNCPVCLISPDTYRRVVLPVDQWYREHYIDFSIHHCGVFHPYRYAYQALRPIHLDVGWGSDLRLIRQVFPTTPMSLEIQAKALLWTDPRALDPTLQQLLADAAPVELVTHLWVAEAGPEVSDDTVRRLVTWP
jgi:hypothetical protein